MNMHTKQQIIDATNLIPGQRVIARSRNLSGRNQPIQFVDAEFVRPASWSAAFAVLRDDTGRLTEWPMTHVQAMA